MAVFDRRPPRRAAGLAAVLALAAGCGGVGGSKPEPSGAAVTLTMMGFATGDEIARTRFDRANQAIAPSTAKAAEGAFNAQQFLSAVASGTPPDLVYMDRTFIGTYAAKGAIVPLDSCIKDEKIDMGQYRKAAVAEVTLGGKVYGLPEFYDNRLVMANAGAAVRTDDWAGLAAAAKSLTRTSGGKLSRIGFDPKIPEFLPLWAKANGADLVSADGRTAHLDDPRVVEAVTFTTDLVKAQGGWSAFKSFRDSFDFFGARNQFATDQLAAFPMEDWYINTLAQNSPQLKLTVTPFLGRDGRPVDWVTGNAWAIPAKSPHAAQACRWIRAATATDSWIAAAKARAQARQQAGKPFAGVFTGNGKADETIFRDIVKPTGNAAFDDAVKVVLQTQDSAFASPALPAGEEFKAAWTNAVNRVLGGEQPPAAAMAQAQREAQAALDRAGR